jgi:hypothetical protein
VPNHGLFTRRRLLGAGAVAGATTLTVASPARAAQPLPAEPAPTQVIPASAVQSKSYPGLSLVAGNELEAPPTGTVFVKDPFNGSYPSTVGGYVGTSLDVLAGSVVQDVVFFLYQQSGSQLCAVQLYHPGAGSSAIEVLLSQPADGTGVISLAASAYSSALPRLITANDSLCAFVWRGQRTCVCRGIRVDFTPPPGTGGSSVSGLVPLPPARVYDSRQGGGKLHANEERVVSVATATDGAAVVPAGATAATITLTVTETEGSGGYVAAFPGGTPWGGTSSINWFGPGQNLATAALVALGGDRGITLRGGAADCHVVVDVAGYVG